MFLRMLLNFQLNRSKGVGKEGVLGLKPPIELDVLQKLYYLRKGD